VFGFRRASNETTRDPAPPEGRSTVWFIGALLAALGPLFILLALGLAFTIYGEASAVLGVACLVAGIVILGRTRRPS
jgi:hypothetical protein